jgi:hypothetical protein
VLPNLIIIGAGKCGTSALWHYLGLHPEISMSRNKELRFFHEKFNWEKGVGWYEGQFANGSTPVRGEASPQYTHYPESRGAAERMHSILPEAKLIYIVRDPIERIISDYVDGVARGRQQRTLAEAVAAPSRSSYVLRSRYMMQLEQYLPYYSMNHILVLTQEMLMSDRRATLAKVFRFLEVDESFDSPGFDEVKNSSLGLRRVEGQPRWMRPNALPVGNSRFPWKLRAAVKRGVYRPFLAPIERPRVDEGLREELAAHLRPDVERLRTITGLRFEGWSL